MYKSLIIILPAVSIASGDVVWTFPFDELGADWTIGGRWTITDTGGSYQNPPAGPQPEWIWSTMSSGTLTMPPGIDSVTVQLTSGYEYYGYAMDGGSQISIEGVVYTGIDDMYLLVDVEDGVVCWNYQSYSGSDTTFISQPIPITSGGTMVMEFTAGMNTYGYIYWAELYWELWDMTITGHGTVALESSTWADIKSMSMAGPVQQDP